MRNFTKTVLLGATLIAAAAAAPSLHAENVPTPSQSQSGTEAPSAPNHQGMMGGNGGQGMMGGGMNGMMGGSNGGRQGMMGDRNDGHQGMMGGRMNGMMGMMNMMTQMSMMNTQMNMMTQMSKMMETCNTMMKSHMDHHDGTHPNERKQAPAQPNKG